MPVMIIPARAPHINPAVPAATRVVLIDLENQHQALSWIPRPNDYVCGFVTTGGLHAVRVDAARYHVDVLVSNNVPDAADLRMVWYLAELALGKGLARNTPVVIVSRDKIFASLAAVIRHMVQVTVRTWPEFSQDEGRE